MKSLSLFHIFYASFFSRLFYRDVHRSWSLGKSFLSLFVVLFVSWIFIMGWLHFTVGNFIDKKLPPLISQVPEASIKNGEIFVSVDQPYFIKDPDKGTILAIIDTTGQIPNLDSQPEAVALITKNTIYYRQGTKIQSRTLQKDLNLEITHASLMGWVKRFSKIALIVFGPLALVFGFLFRMVQALVYSLFGLLFNQILKTSLTYSQIYKLSLVALTPALLFRLFLTITPLRSVGFFVTGVVSIVLALAMLFFAMQSNAQNEDTPSGEISTI